MSEAPGPAPEASGVGRRPGEQPVAAGGVLWARAADGLEIAVVRRPGSDEWSLPVTDIRADETPLAAARRAALDQTGVRPVVGPKLSPGPLAPPAEPAPVSYWAMRAPDGRPSAGDRPSPSGDLDRVAWLPQREAKARLTDQGEIAAVDALKQVAPSVDTVLLLVRHASVGHQSRWEADDRRRPLDEEGLDQAARLRHGLAAFAPDELRAVDNARCMGTLEPLADDLHLTVRIEVLLSDDTAPDRRLGRFRELACSHRRVAVSTSPTVIQPLLAAVTGVGDGDLPDTREGSAWALFFDDHGRLVAADYYPTFARPTR